MRSVPSVFLPMLYPNLNQLVLWLVLVKILAGFRSSMFVRLSFFRFVQCLVLIISVRNIAGSSSPIILRRLEELATDRALLGATYLIDCGK